MNAADHPPSWQARLINLLVRARMRPHAHKPIDPGFVRAHIGQPRSVRRLMFRASGARAQRILSDAARPAGDWVVGRNSTDASPVILYLHGGGYIACSPETHRPLVGSLTTRLNARAFVPAYRLAPENPYPAALDDAVASYRFLLEQHRIEPSRIIIAGDSAGGGLALATAMRIRDEALPQPSAILLFSPWTDMA
ncbi:MAG: alpha/beta hydrolase fold domain-containing protein, partial [Gemmatimonadaceae bacterium]